MGRRKKGDPVNGWINLDKPLNMTSTEAVSKVRRLFNAQKAGHAGTLDPLATGILPIALGEATKTVPFLMEAGKTYRFTIAWGAATATFDREGEVIARSDVRPSREAVEAVLPQFIGEIEQAPPIYSAIKVGGQRAESPPGRGGSVRQRGAGVARDRPLHGRHARLGRDANDGISWSGSDRRRGSDAG